MKDELATYTFLPWVRQGIANQISGQSGNRAVIPVALTVKGDNVSGTGETSTTVSKDIEIYGPGDITGLDSKTIVKVEPQNWITNFEPNYLPFIDFYDEDLPWRYSPATPNQHRLKPWLALVVLKESEFSDDKNAKDKPLPNIVLNADAQLQSSEQLWAWAHVHVNRDLIEEGFMEDENGNSAIAKALGEVVEENPDLAHSRIVSPRKLEAKMTYHAFLVPVFESGRLAGLGQDPTAAADALATSWQDGANMDGLQLPYYHRWSFQTGTIGDFEYLVRLLKPQPVDKRVGKRDMDVQKPGANLKGIDGADALEGVLKLGGALKVPDLFFSNEEFVQVQNSEYWAFRGDLTEEQITALSTDTQPVNISDFHVFQKNIAAFINLSDGYKKDSALSVHQSSGIEEFEDTNDPDSAYNINENPDPLLTAPLYGQWHALTQRLIKETDDSNINPNYNWVHELNLDARWRVSAGFGTKVVQDNQEPYMKSAWDQVGAIVEANNKIRQAQLAKTVAQMFHFKHLAPIKEKSQGTFLSLAAPLHGRVLNEGVTVYHEKKLSLMSSAPSSTNMRKLMRPRGKLMKRLAFDEPSPLGGLIERVNSGEISAAPPKTTPEGLVTTDDLIEATKPTNIPGFIDSWLDKYRWLQWVPLILAIIIVLLLLLLRPSGVVWAIGVALASVLLYFYNLLNKWGKAKAAYEGLKEENQTEASVDNLPKSPDFEITFPRMSFLPSFGTTDSAEATKFKLALQHVNATFQESLNLGVIRPRPTLNLQTINNVVFDGLHPNLTIPRWVLNGFVLPPIFEAQVKEVFVEAMAYPKFNLPMYKPLVEHSAELFLPNVNYIAQNSISILETNQKFIEAYMVGLNHEFARELLWREYPTDQRGSYFRQFWDVDGYLDTHPIEKNSVVERLNTILSVQENAELQVYYDQLTGSAGPIDAAYLLEAHQQVLHEELKDIKPLHYWEKASKLGEHDNRESGEEDQEEVVLAIRGELLKKYPTAVIYAHKAVWQDEDNQPVLSNSQTIDPTKERTLMPLSEDQQNEPPATLMKSPLYEAKVDPDIYFFGFDLNVCESKGGTGKESDEVEERCAQEGVQWDDAGWFFVIKERPGEPRFGLDIGEGGNIEDNKIELWNDLSWGDLKPAVPSGGFIQITNEMNVTADQELEIDDSEKINQQNDDNNISWNKDMSAAELAYILYQVPVLVAVHASEMLPDVPSS